jgi:hypothetical protein
MDQIRPHHIMLHFLFLREADIGTVAIKDSALNLSTVLSLMIIAYKKSLVKRKYKILRKQMVFFTILRANHTGFRIHIQYPHHKKEHRLCRCHLLRKCFTVASLAYGVISLSPRPKNSRTGCFCPPYGMGTGFRIHVQYPPTTKKSIDYVDALFCAKKRTNGA